ncbi:MAG TPA: DUF4956 domain-containing protein [Flavobacterium sp.]|jgi:hypothetical protein|uniref:DUF4956 domain-containing protein n=1 Tax=Flavobacterium sp. TaxID=239 RepID=UPI002CE5DF77|nr:DUF4956 domain-containing protein [Flavobacterium sp.]MCA0347820.1 DUF4956 domain-containing protein [Bacteroidota bacterium]HPW97939.1 DUF4956 domain-containing protein [Flavobacterium sp.]HQA74079.1 DUF4956 domain-containing protein [Flavobacterium sp.]
MEEVVANAKDVLNIVDFGTRAALNIIALALLVSLIYYPKHKNKDFIFTFVIFNIINFMICYLLGSAKIKIGFAFGLFAIFSIIRYRTILVSIKDMGYFFICVALGMLNSLASVKDDFVMLIICNAVILVLTFFLERLDFLKNENSKDILYDKINFIKPQMRAELIGDLSERTGLPIHRVEIVSIDYLKDVASVKAYYYSTESDSLFEETNDKDDKYD